MDGDFRRIHFGEGSKRRHIPKMATIVQCDCGAEYKRTETKFLVPHTGHASCKVCGATLESLVAKHPRCHIRAGQPSRPKARTRPLLAALVSAAPVCLSSAQDAKVSVDMMGIGGMSCAHWQSTQALRLEGTIWIYGFWTGLNYVAAASGQTETKVDTAAVMVEVKKTCAQRPSQVLASAVWTAYLDLNKR